MTNSILLQFGYTKCRQAEAHPTLLDFFVQVVLAAGGTKLLELKTRCGRLLVLHVRVVLAFALSALKRYNFTWHRAAPIR